MRQRRIDLRAFLTLIPLSLIFSGDYTVVETPVPIPNTVVKHRGPMILANAGKVGHRRDFYEEGSSSQGASLLSFQEPEHEEPIAFHAPSPLTTAVLKIPQDSSIIFQNFTWSNQCNQGQPPGPPGPRGQPPIFVPVLQSQTMG